MIHTLKIKQPYFQAVIGGDKTFEIRFNDRGYQKGDQIILEEIYEHSGLYTRQKARADISYVTNLEQENNLVVFGIKNVKLIDIK